MKNFHLSLLSALTCITLTSQTYAAQTIQVELKGTLISNTLCRYKYVNSFSTFPDVEIYRTCTSNSVLSKQENGNCHYENKFHSAVEVKSPSEYVLLIYGDIETLGTSTGTSCPVHTLTLALR